MTGIGEGGSSVKGKGESNSTRRNLLCLHVSELTSLPFSFSSFQVQPPMRSIVLSLSLSLSLFLSLSLSQSLRLTCFLSPRSIPTSRRVPFPIKHFLAHLALCTLYHYIYSRSHFVTLCLSDDGSLNLAEVKACSLERWQKGKEKERSEIRAP